jgi:alpha-glucosidase (family GH31 glycosyl hydrolase)
MAAWSIEGTGAVFAAPDEGWSARLDQQGPLCSLLDANGQPVVALASGEHYPEAGLAIRVVGQWRALGQPDEVALEDERVVAVWREPAAEVVVSGEPETGLRLALRAPGAEAMAMALAVGPGERFYGLGERFNKLDQRGEMVELWVKNGASGGNTYKPIPFVASSAGYGVAIDSSRRVFAALAHPTTPGVATFTVEGDELVAWLIPGPGPVDVVRRYTAWVGRPPIPPAWFFRPWKSRDWRYENQQTVLEDIAKQQEFGIPCGVKLIDAAWETAGHSFVFDPAKYPDVPAMMRALEEAGLELVLWLSPSMTAGSPEYDECARIAADRDVPLRQVYDAAHAAFAQGRVLDAANPAS